MASSNLTFGVTIRITVPALFCVAGQVSVAGLWDQPRPQTRLWRTQAAPRPRTWQTTQLPGAHSGRF
jgi:hypothetical protein